MNPNIRITQNAMPFTQLSETGEPTASQLECYRISVSFGDDGGVGDNLRKTIATLAESLTKEMDIQEWTMLAFVDIGDLAQWLGGVGIIKSDESVRLYSSELESVIIK